MTNSEYIELINKALEQCFEEELKTDYSVLAQAMRYSLLAGGKRIRPMLCLEFCRICGGDVEAAIPAALGLEMLHTYSLIHDDLPSMDNDELRRGKPTNHMVYGEWQALLAGDSLQAAAFESVLTARLPAERRALCALILAQAVGVNGMCGGQYMDMAWEGLELSTEQLNHINALKTGALLIAACKMGVAAAGGTDAQMKAAEEFGRNIGLAFQIRDDMLDVISTAEELGKPIGSDMEEHKNTYMALLGEAKCAEKVHELSVNAKKCLSEAFDDVAFLTALVDGMETRRN